MKILIVLGSPNSEDGILSPMALLCIQKCMELYDPHSCKIVLTGGFGVHFNTSNLPHYGHLKKYLLKNGISEEAILELIPSRHSVEDASLSHFILKKYKPKEIIIITSDYHQKRAGLIFETIFAPYNRITVIGANSETIDKALIDPLVSHEHLAFQDLIENGVRFSIPE